MTTVDLSLSSFTGALKTGFRLQLESGTRLDLELIEAVDELEGKSAPPGRESFSLTFRGAHAEPLSQGTYSFEHDGIGTFDIFIVPVQQDEKGVYYQAVFNRLGDA